MRGGRRAATGRRGEGLVAGEWAGLRSGVAGSGERN